MKTYEVELFIMGCPSSPYTNEKITIEAESQDEAEQKAHDIYFPKGYGVLSSRQVNELKWLDTEYMRADLTVQPVLVSGTLWYTVFDNHGYNLVFNTLLGLYEWLNGNGCEEGNCFETEDEMIEYLEGV